MSKFHITVYSNMGYKRGFPQPKYPSAGSGDFSTESCEEVQSRKKLNFSNT